MTRIVCGVDEAGRGPLAGAVFAACVVLDPHRPITGLADSKALSAGERETLARLIRARALSWAVASASVAEIDALNILQATMLAMQRAVAQLELVPDEVLVDGNRCPQIAYTVRAVVKGDALIPAISAASILAKTTRDAAMLDLHRAYPEYGFDRHKGYPTPDHLAALARHGVSPCHRRSFGPVRAALAQASLPFGERVEG
jgi:ribonuclease HII